MVENKPVPDELVALRDRIDSIDEEIVMALARRFQVTGKIGRIKAENGLDSVDEAREREKLARLAQLAEESGLNSAFVTELFQLIFREVVKNHRGYL